MPIPITDEDKKFAAFSAISMATNAYGQIASAYHAIESTSFANKQAALDALNALFEAQSAAGTAIDNLGLI